MQQLNQILENRFINNLTSLLEHSPLQINSTHQSDAEIIRFNGNNDQLINITTDSICEEIKAGLYDDFLAGWMVVSANLSDLAAVGSNPLGILISVIFPENMNYKRIGTLYNGINSACKRHSTYVLGGDINKGDNLIVTGTALGVNNYNKILTRVGCKPGNILYSTGQLGKGNAFALDKLFFRKGAALNYKPVARLKEGKVVSQFATACMDTSDGIFTTLDQLMRLNNIGFEICNNWELLIEKNSREYAQKVGIPLWMLLAGQHGEFELLFTIPEEREKQFINSAIQVGFFPLKLGRVIKTPIINISLYDKMISLDTARIRNLFDNCDGNLEKYFDEMLKIDSELKQN